MKNRPEWPPPPPVSAHQAWELERAALANTHNEQRAMIAQLQAQAWGLVRKQNVGASNTTSGYTNFTYNYPAAYPIQYASTTTQYADNAASKAPRPKLTEVDRLRMRVDEMCDYAFQKVA